MKNELKDKVVSIQIGLEILQQVVERSLAVIKQELKENNVVDACYEVLAIVRELEYRVPLVGLNSEILGLMLSKYTYDPEVN